MPRLQGVQVARELGLNKSTVSRQARAWGLVGADGLIDLDQYRARRDADLNPLMSREPGPWAAAPPNAAAPDLGATPAPATVASANAERTALQAELLRLRLDREAGRQLHADAVASEIAEAGSIFAAAVGAIPSRLAVPLAAETDPDTVERLLAAAINDALAELDAALAAAMEAAKADAQDDIEEP